MKTISFLSFVCLMGNITLNGFNTDELNVENLAKEAYTEHVSAFDCLFSLTKVYSFLELGMGKGTKYFLDHCDEVTSLEISIASRSKDIESWCLECLASYCRFTNWNPKLYRASGVLDFYNGHFALEYWEQTGHYFPNHLKEYLAEIHSICAQLLQFRKYDLVFIDPGIFTRADFVNAFFDHVDIIVAHDTHTDYYGWPRVIQHPFYERIEAVGKYGSTRFWIHKKKEKLIEDLKRALKEIGAS